MEWYNSISKDRQSALDIIGEFCTKYPLSFYLRKTDGKIGRVRVKLSSPRKPKNVMLTADMWVYSPITEYYARNVPDEENPFFPANCQLCYNHDPWDWDKEFAICKAMATNPAVKSLWDLWKLVPSSFMEALDLEQL